MIKIKEIYPMITLCFKRQDSEIFNTRSIEESSLGWHLENDKEMMSGLAFIIKGNYIGVTKQDVENIEKLQPINFGYIKDKKGKKYLHK